MSFGGKPPYERPRDSAAVRENDDCPCSLQSLCSSGENEQPRHAVHGVGPLESGQAGPEAWREGGHGPERAVDVEPEALLAAKLGREARGVAPVAVELR